MASTVVIPASAVVVVADARKAIFLRNEGEAASVNLKVVREIHAPENPPTHLQGTARPGRTMIGSRRSALEETDWHQQAEANFAAVVATALAALPGEPQLVLVSPPSFLGEVRKKVPAAAADRIIAEQTKDLTHLPVFEIGRALTGEPAR